MGGVSESEIGGKWRKSWEIFCILTLGSIDAFFQDSKNEPSQKMEKFFSHFDILAHFFFFL